jgi:hypothetical protein
MLYKDYYDFDTNNTPPYFFNYLFITKKKFV